MVTSRHRSGQPTNCQGKGSELSLDIQQGSLKISGLRSHASSPGGVKSRAQEEQDCSERKMASEQIQVDREPGHQEQGPVEEPRKHPRERQEEEPS